MYGREKIKDYANDILVIIRSTGERTEQVCRDLLTRMFPEKNIIIVKETPFSQSIRKSFEIAMERNLPWTLCLDADVLVDIEQLPKLFRKISVVNDNIFQIQGLVLDKFLPIWRPAGNHLYRTSLMEKAAVHIPKEGLSLRPETDMLNTMSRLGHPWMQCDVKVGIHDFEQYYEDIFRKCFLQAHKHGPFMPLIEPYWNEKSRIDTDFTVALMGLQAGKNFHDTVYVDKKFLVKETRDAFHDKGIVEKDLLTSSMYLVKIANNNERHYINEEIQNSIFPNERWNTLSPSSIYGGFEIKEIQLPKYNFNLWTQPRFHHQYAKMVQEESTTHESFISDLIKNFAKSVNLFIDVGAYHGYYSLLVKKNNPACEVVAIEPVDENIEILNFNLRTNEVSDVRLLKAAASDRVGSAPFFVSEETDKSSLAELPSLPVKRRENVDLITMSVILQQHIDQPSLIHIDINGLELKVLDGMLHELKNRDNVRLIIEYNPEHLRLAGYQPELLLEKLESIGFDIFIVGKDEHRFYRLKTNRIKETNEEQGRASLICIKKSRSISVAFFSHSGGLAGAERSLIDLIGQLVQDYGVLCTIYLPEGPSCQRLKELGASVIQFDAAWWSRLSDNQTDLSKAFREELARSLHTLLSNIDNLRKISPDVVCTNTMVIPWGALAAMLIDKPHFWMVNEFGQADHNLRFLYPFEEILRIIKQYSNKVITRSKIIQQTLFGNQFDNHIETIYRNIRIPSSARNITVAKERGLHIFFPGRIIPSKGQKEAALAILDLLEQDLDIEITFAGEIGDINYFNELIGLVKDAQKQDKVFFLPFQEDIVPFYEKADIVLVCSKNEAFGRVVLEAMIMQRAVIATNAGGNPELIQDGVNGLLYEPGNIQQLSDCIKKLYNDRELRLSLGKEAFNFSTRTFSREKFGGRYYNLFLEYKNTRNVASSLSGRWAIDFFLFEWFFQNQQLISLKSRLAERDRQLAERDAQLAERDAQLRKIQFSKAWRFAMLVRQIQERLAPPGSWRARIGLKAFSLLRIPISIYREYKMRTELRLVYNSGLFDRDWYLANNPDVAKATIDPARHYLLYGGFEGRDPSPGFSSTWYLDTYEDVRNAGINPLLHYLRFGRVEGRHPKSPNQTE